jgi:O-antigen ligase
MISNPVNKFVINHTLMIKLITFFVVLTFFSVNVNLFLIYILIPVFFAFSNFIDYKTWGNRHLILFFFLILWSAVSAFVVGEDFNSSFKVLRSMLLTFFFGFQLITLSTKSENSIKWFYILVLVFYLMNWYSAIFQYDLSKADVFDLGFRGSLEVFENINANRFGYFILFLTFAVFLFGEERVNSKALKYYRLIFLVSIFIIILNALYTGSRQILLLNVPLYFIFFFLRYWTIITKKYGFIALSFIFIILLVGFWILMAYVDKSAVGQRGGNESFEEDARAIVAITAINFGLENPFFGIGPGHMEYNLGMISHNSFTEIFAETGFIGLFLYLFLLFNGLFIQFKRYIRTNDKVFLYFFLYIFFYILDNLFYVFYSWYLLFGIFFLVVTHSDFYYKKHFTFKRNILLTKK